MQNSSGIDDLKAQAPALQSEATALKTVKTDKRATLALASVAAAAAFAVGYGVHQDPPALPASIAGDPDYQRLVSTLDSDTLLLNADDKLSNLRALYGAETGPLGIAPEMIGAEKQVPVKNTRDCIRKAFDYAVEARQPVKFTCEKYQPLLAKAPFFETRLVGLLSYDAQENRVELKDLALLEYAREEEKLTRSDVDRGDAFIYYGPMHKYEAHELDRLRETVPMRAPFGRAASTATYGADSHIPIERNVAARNKPARASAPRERECIRQAFAFSIAHDRKFAVENPSYNREAPWLDHVIFNCASAGGTILVGDIESEYVGSPGNDEYGRLAESIYRVWRR